MLATYLDEWQQRMIQILDGDAQDPVKRVDVIHRVKVMRDELGVREAKIQKAHENETLLNEVQKCLQHFDQYLAPQLGQMRFVPSSALVTSKSLFRPKWAASHSACRHPSQKANR